jgi:hypothetical protein
MTIERMDTWTAILSSTGREPFIGPVWLADGTPLNEEGWAQTVEVYIGCEGVRSSLAVAGGPLLCAEIPYETVDAMVSRRRA